MLVCICRVPEGAAHVPHGPLDGPQASAGCRADGPTPAMLLPGWYQHGKDACAQQHPHTLRPMQLVAQAAHCGPAAALATTLQLVMWEQDFRSTYRSRPSTPDVRQRLLHPDENKNCQLPHPPTPQPLILDRA